MRRKKKREEKIITIIINIKSERKETAKRGK